MSRFTGAPIDHGQDRIYPCINGTSGDRTSVSFNGAISCRTCICRKDEMSGKNANHPELKAMLEYVREGDTLYIESISRLGRSTRDLLNIIDVLQRKGVTLVSSKENIETNTPQGRFVLSIFAALSELEREQTLQRQREGIAIAKSQGKYKGRQPISIDWIKFSHLYKQWKSGTITAVWFQKEMGLRANTFYRRLKEYERKFT